MPRVRPNSILRAQLGSVEIFKNFRQFHLLKLMKLNPPLEPQNLFDRWPNVLNCSSSLKKIIHKIKNLNNSLLTWPADNQIGIAIHIIDIK